MPSRRRVGFIVTRNTAGISNDKLMRAVLSDVGMAHMPMFYWWIPKGSIASDKIYLEVMISIRNAENDIAFYQRGLPVKFNWFESLEFIDKPFDLRRSMSDTLLGCIGFGTVNPWGPVAQRMLIYHSDPKKVYGNILEAVPGHFLPGTFCEKVKPLSQSYDVFPYHDMPYQILRTLKDDGLTLAAIDRIRNKELAKSSRSARKRKCGH